MDPATLTAFIAPFLPFLLNLGKKAAETLTERGSQQFGDAAWQKAQRAWKLLSPKVEAKEAAKEVAVDVATNPEDEDSLAALRLQMRKILEKDESLATEIAQLLDADAPDGTPGMQIVQNVTGNKNQVIGQVSGGKVFGSIEGNGLFKSEVLQQMSGSQSPDFNKPDTTSEIWQEIRGDKNQTIGQVYGGIVVYVSGGQAVIHAPQDKGSQPSESERVIVPNPYKGLLAFHEEDSALYFGRLREIETLWKQFRDIHEHDAAVRLLPIYGPSGSGKSSLARAGLIPALGNRPLPGRERARVAVLVPGTQPLQALATVLARISKNDLTPVKKIREFAEELALVNKAGQYDGLQRIANALPEIETFPLVVLVDQFEEVYSLCEDAQARDALISNLLYAAGDLSQYVSVIITLRSDFLGETHKHSTLNRLFSTQGFLVPAMDEAALREAIAKPAEATGQPLDEVTIQLLIEQTEGREGALPLLQFALTRIWEGMADGNPPAKTLEDIGGVGGALAGEAQRVYDSLSPPEQEIARRLFLGLVQLGEGTRDTRRRATVASLMARSDNPEQFYRVIEHFTDPGVRLMTLSAEGTEETAEVTHEALFDHWRQLSDWLDSSRDDIRFQRRLDEAAKYWGVQKRPASLLWRRPDLDLLRSYHKRFSQQMTALQLDFFRASMSSATRQKLLQGTAVSSLAVLAAGMTWFGIQARRAEQRALARQLAGQAEQLLNQPSVTQQEAGALLAVKSLEPLQTWKLGPLKLEHKESGDVNQVLRSGLGIKLFFATLNHDAAVNAVAFSADGSRVATASDDGTARVWDAHSGETLATLNHDDRIRAIAFSADGERVATASDDHTARVWDVQSRGTLATLNHDDRIRAIAFSADGERVATASDDHTARVWDVQSRGTLATLKHDARINAVAFSADGERVATASNDGTARVWDVQSDEPLVTLKHADWVNAVAFSADGKRVATASDDGTARVWDVQSRGPLVTLNHADRFRAPMAFSADGERVATASWRAMREGWYLTRFSTARVWDVQSGETLATLNHDDKVNAVAFSADGERVATASDDHTARVWDVQSGETLTTLNHDDRIRAIAFSADGSRVVTASSSATAQVWEAQSDETLATLNHADEVNAVAFSADGSRVATASNDGTAWVWDVQSDETLAILNHADEVNAVAFSADGSRVATASNDGTAWVWDVQSDEPLAILNHADEVNAVAFSADGSRVATASNDGTARVWDVQSDEPLVTLNHAGWVDAMAFSADGKRVATANWSATTLLWDASSSATARVWDVQSRETLATLEHDARINAVAFSADGSRVATASNDGTARVWDVQSDEPLVTLNHDDGVNAVAFSADGKRVATASNDGTARVWDVQSDEPLVTLNHDDGVNAVAFSADGKRVATASNDGTARVWDVQSDEPLVTLNHDDGVNAVAFSADGKRVATASRDNTARVHWLWSHDLAEQLCRRLSRNLMAAEWAKYIQTELTDYSLTCSNLPVHSTVIDEAQKKC